MDSQRRSIISVALPYSQQQSAINQLTYLLVLTYFVAFITLTREALYTCHKQITLVHNYIELFFSIFKASHSTEFTGILRKTHS